MSERQPQRHAVIATALPPPLLVSPTTTPLPSFPFSLPSLPSPPLHSLPFPFPPLPSLPLLTSMPLPPPPRSFPPLPQLSGITVRMVPMEDDPAWHLAEVVVENTDAGTSNTFTYNNWLSATGVTSATLCRRYGGQLAPVRSVSATWVTSAMLYRLALVRAS